MLFSDNPMSRNKNHPDAKTVEPAAILQSEMIISRCGYTTVMDLVKLFKKAILIPTPGQTEQEYLAKYVMEKKIFYTAEQKNFHKDLEEEKGLQQKFFVSFFLPRHMIWEQ